VPTYIRLLDVNPECGGAVGFEPTIRGTNDGFQALDTLNHFGVYEINNNY
jgi:hypothetical protein